MYSNVTEGIEAIRALVLSEEENGSIIVDDEIKNTLLSTMRMHKSALELSQQTYKTHALWCEMSLLQNPFNPELFLFSIYQMLAKRYAVPVSWISCLPLTVNASLKNIKIHITPNENLVLIDEQGYATENFYAAHLDGIEAGLIIDGKPFLLQRTPAAVEFTKSANADNTMDAIFSTMFSLFDDTLDMSLPDEPKES